MTHDFLNDLQVGFVLAEASAERVPQDMAAKLWQKNRVTIFFLRLGFFFLIIVCTNRADSAVDGIGEINLSIASAENKAGVSINFIAAETDDFLILIFFQKGIKHFIKHRDNADASFRFGRVYISVLYEWRGDAEDSDRHLVSGQICDVRSSIIIGNGGVIGG